MLRETHDSLLENIQTSFEEQGQIKNKRHLLLGNMASLYGVVAVVEVGEELHALRLKAGLISLGATVQQMWSRLVTHVVWAEGGCRATRAVSRSQACYVVSPLWVDACCTAGSRLPERAFPTAARHSDLPSPKRLAKLVRKALRENEPVINYLPDNGNTSRPWLRVPTSTVTSEESSDHSAENFNTTEDEQEYIDVAAGVNTAPRRALPLSSSPPPPPPPMRPRRHLFSHRELRYSISDDEDMDRNSPGPSAARKRPKPSEGETGTDPPRVNPASGEVAEKRARLAGPPQQRSDLNLAVERPDRHSPSPAPRPRPLLPILPLMPNIPLMPNQPAIGARAGRPRIVLTGMSRDERREMISMCRALRGKVQRRVTKCTTHVVMGSCQNSRSTETPGSPTSRTRRSRTLNALLGAARGCRVVTPQWARDCFRRNRWLAHNGYEVAHLKRLADKAYEERRGLSMLNHDYGCNVFGWSHIQLSSTAENKRGAEQLLALCGAIVLDDDCTITHNSVYLQDGVEEPLVPEFSVGPAAGQLNTRWVFDSVVATRMKRLRNYTQA